MGQKDISEKILVDYNDVFADIINVCVYDGEEVVKPDDLEKALYRWHRLCYTLVQKNDGIGIELLKNA